VLEEFGFICLECKRLERLPYYFGEAESGAG